MKAHIRYIFFENEKLGEFIRNEANNENWPTASTYGEKVYKDWKTEIDKQQEEIDQIESKNNKTKELIANVRTWFINEYNRLGKEKQKECSECKTIFPILSAKKDIKNCPECKVNIWAKKRTQESPYEQEDLFPYLRESKFETFAKFFEILKDEEENPIIIEEGSKLGELVEHLDEWHYHNEGKNIEPNPYEIFVNERKQDTITFEWIPLEREIGDKKGKFLSLLTNYLFNYYGEWYEVKDWIQDGYNLVKIIVERSIFYNDYWYLIQCQTSGILHHSQNKSLVAREEICSCPQYDIATNFYDFGSTYQLKLDLYKLDKTLLKIGGEINEEDLKMIVPVNVSRVREKENEPSDPFEINVRVTDTLKGIWNEMWASSIGTVYFLLSERLGKFATFRQTFIDEKWREYKLDTNDKFKNTNPVGDEITKVLNEFHLLDEDMFHFLRNHIKASLYWRKKQIWQGNYWLIHENFRIMESVNPSGNCFTFYGTNNTILTRLTESITSKVGGNSFVNKFFDCIIDTALSDDKGQNNRQSERATITESNYNGHGKLKETTVKTTEKTKDSPKGGNNGGVQMGKPFLHPHLYNVDHNKSEYTFYQFWHRYIMGGKYPISLRIEFSQILLNQYRAKRAIKGKMTYDYYNSLSLGNILNSPGFLKSSIISWNMTRNPDWFREKIEDGINLWEKDYKELYQKTLPGIINIGSRGGNGTGNFNVTSFITKSKLSSATDDQTNLDGMSWVFKSSFLRREDGIGGNHFPNLIADGSQYIREQSNDHSASNCSHRFCTPSHSGTWRFGAQSNWTSKPFFPPKGVMFEWHLKSFIKGPSQDYGIKGKGEDDKIFLIQEGKKWTIFLDGEFDVTNINGDPEGVPPANNSIPSGVDFQLPTNPFNLNNLPSNGNITPGPTGGETEPNVPEIDPTSDPDFPPDIDPGVDFDNGLDKGDIDPNDYDPGDIDPGDGADND